MGNEGKQIGLEVTLSSPVLPTPVSIQHPGNDSPPCCWLCSSVTSQQGGP
jgi:hypothetical protein